MGWGDEQENAFDLIVFPVPTPVRIARLQHRETRRFGRAPARLSGWACNMTKARKKEEACQTPRVANTARTCPVLALEGDLAVAVCLESSCIGCAWNQRMTPHMMAVPIR